MFGILRNLSIFFALHGIAGDSFVIFAILLYLKLNFATRNPSGLHVEPLTLQKGGTLGPPTPRAPAATLQGAKARTYSVEKIQQSC